MKRRRQASWPGRPSLGMGICWLEASVTQSSSGSRLEVGLGTRASSRPVYGVGKSDSEEQDLMSYEPHRSFRAPQKH